MKNRCFIIALVFMTIIGGIYFYKNKEKRKLKKSLIYNKIIEFKENENLEKIINLSEFQENSKEYYLLKGIEEYYLNNLDEAYEFLLKAQENNKGNDVVFDVYLNFFLNNCENVLKEGGSIERAKYIMKNIGKISELKNNTEFIWEALVGIISDEKSREVSIEILEGYMKEVKNLELITQIKLKGFIGILKILNENYVESIHLFYEIILDADKIKDIEQRNRLKMKAYEYIGNMSFLLENYEDAIDQYNMVVSIFLKDNEENAITKYGSYINRTTAYIEIKDYESARKSSDETKEIIAFIPKDIIEDIELLFYNNLARIEIYQGNIEKAKEYLEKCQTLLKSNRNSGFLNIDIHINFSYAELYLKEGKKEQALELLDKLLLINNENESGFEKDIYLLQMEIYRKNNKIEKFFEVYDKYDESNKRENLMLKKNYLKFVKSSFEEKKLKEKERETALKIKLLVSILFAILFGAVSQILKIIKLKENNLTDQLTEIYNRKYLDAVYKSLEKNKIFNMGILMIDIDFFKKYNDNYGHIMGDIVIKTVAEILKSSVGKKDSVIRYGGEEFLIILRKSDKEYLEDIYKKIYFKLEEERIIHEKSLVSDHITLSVGGTQGVVNDKNTFLSLIKKADEALYKAKEEGRNRIVVL